VTYAVAVGGFDRIEDAEFRQALMAVPPRSQEPVDSG
jgi:hypothetical protein